jgi:hypothetical protein
MLMASFIIACALFAREREREREREKACGSIGTGLSTIRNELFYLPPPDTQLPFTRCDDDDDARYPTDKRCEIRVFLFFFHVSL